MRFVASGVLNGAADQADGSGAADGLGDGFGRIAKTLFEIGRDGKIGIGDDLACVFESFVAREFAVFLADGDGRSGAGSRERVEAESFECASRTDVPWIGDDERSGRGVKRAKAHSFVMLSDAHGGRLRVA